MLTTDKYVYFLLCGNDTNKDTTNYKYATELCNTNEGQLKQQFANGFDAERMVYTAETLESTVKAYLDAKEDERFVLSETFNDGDVLIQDILEADGNYYVTNKGELFVVGNGTRAEYDVDKFKLRLKHSCYVKDTSGKKAIIKFDKVKYSVKLNQLRTIIAWSNQDPIW